MHHFLRADFIKYFVQSQFEANVKRKYTFIHNEYTQKFIPVRLFRSFLSAFQVENVLFP